MGSITGDREYQIKKSIKEQTEGYKSVTGVKNIEVNKPIKYCMIYDKWEYELTDHPVLIKPQGQRQRFTANWKIKITEQKGRYKGLVVKFPVIRMVVESHPKKKEELSGGLVFEVELIQNPKKIKLNQEDMKVFSTILVNLFNNGVESMQNNDLVHNGVNKRGIKRARGYIGGGAEGDNFTEV